MLIRKKNIRGSGVPTATSHATQGKSAGNYMETPKPRIGEEKKARMGTQGRTSKKGGKAHIANRQGEGFVQLNHEEIERVRSFLSKLEKPTGTCFLTYSSKFLVSFGFNVSDTPFTHYWILDSGATNHMTPLPKYFSTYSPCPSN